MCYTCHPFKQTKFMHEYYFLCEFKGEHGNLSAKSCPIFSSFHILPSFCQRTQRPQICTIISESLITSISLEIFSSWLPVILFFLGQGKDAAIGKRKKHSAPRLPCAVNLPYHGRKMSYLLDVHWKDGKGHKSEMNILLCLSIYVIALQYLFDYIYSFDLYKWTQVNCLLLYGIHFQAELEQLGVRGTQLW